MCPNQAIIFPKYGDAPINGAEVSEELIRDNGLLMIKKESASSVASVNQPSSINHHQSAASAGDILDRIRQRAAGHKRFSTQPQEASVARSCPTIDSLRKELGIPDEVLGSLSPAELARIRGKSQQSNAEKPRGGVDNEAGGREKAHHD
jgi:hypothetical protein